jgi:hypothetical protein
MKKLIFILSALNLFTSCEKEVKLSTKKPITKSEYPVRFFDTTFFADYEAIGVKTLSRHNDIIIGIGELEGVRELKNRGYNF